jgi:hypothetical protein
MEATKKVMLSYHFFWDMMLLRWVLRPMILDSLDQEPNTQ